MENLGKYKIIRVIGEGGMGRVYEAVDPIIGRRVAIKTIALNIAADEETRARFFREAQAAGQLSHPNLITIHDIGEADGQPYIVMEYLEGADLSRKIRSERLSLDTKVQIMLDMCDGLAFAHGHDVVHRDIKPGNIFITTQGRVKILDFGLARGALSDMTRTGNVVGTPNYMAPEQIKGEEVDHRADIFSAGVVFYELLSGRKAFEGDSIANTIYKVLETEPHPIQMLDAALPAELSPIIERAIAKDKTARFQTSNELLDALVRVPVPRDPDRIRTPSLPMSRTHVIPPAASPAVTSATVTQVAPQTPARQPAHGKAVWQVVAIAAVVVAVAIGFFAVGRIQRGTTEPPTATVAPPSGTAPAAQGVAPVTPSEGAATASAPSLAPGASQPPAIQTNATPPVAAPPLPSSRRPPAEPARPNQAASARQVQESAPSATSPPIPAPPPAQVAVAPAAPPVTAPPPAAPEPRTAPIQPPVASAPAAAPTPAAPRESPPVSAEAAATAMIQDVVASYQAALEARDIRALKRIWPSLAGRQEDALRTEFQNARAIDATLSGVTVRVAGAMATVRCQRNYRVTTADGKALESATHMTMTLNNRDGAWAITSIQHEAIR